MGDTAKTILGRVGMVLRGEYDSTEEYERLDVVTHNGSSFAGLKTSVGIEPPNEEYWQPIADVTKALADVEEAVGNAELATDNANEAAQQAVQTANAASVEAVRIANEAAQNAAETASNAAETANDAAERADEAARGIDAKVEAATAEVTAAVDALHRGKAPAIECEASGNIVSVSDAAAQPAVQLVSHIEPAQAGSGDPSPTNVRPISGWDAVNVARARKNVFNMDTCTAGFYIDNANGELKSTGLPLLASAWIAIPKGIQQIFISSTQTSGQWGAFYNAQKEFISGILVYNRIYNVPTNAVYMRLTAEQTTKGTLQVEFGSTATAYEPYQGQTLTADLPETVYGGTLDWTTGLLTVTHEKDIVSSAKLNAVSSSYKYALMHVVNFNGAKSQSLVLCDKLPTKAYVENFAGYVCIHTDNRLFVGLPFDWIGATGNESNTEISALANQWLAANPLAVVYELETPYTIQLTSQQLDMLKGTNNVWSDSGDTSVVYVADTKMYIDNLFGSLSAAIINV